MNLPTVLLCFIALIFALVGMAKMLALGPMPKMAAHAGFSTTGYRVIGSLELAGAVGVTLGPCRAAVRSPGRHRFAAASRRRCGNPRPQWRQAAQPHPCSTWRGTDCLVPRAPRRDYLVNRPGRLPHALRGPGLPSVTDDTTL